MCLLEDINLKPIKYQPDINYESISVYNQEYTRDKVLSLLTNIKIKIRIEDLSYQEFYDLLFELPGIDKDFKITRKIYDKLIDKVREDKNYYANISSVDAYRKFINRGKVLARSGKDITFHPSNDTFYSDKRDLCRGILDGHYILDVPRRLGEDKISKAFGVRRFKETKVTVDENYVIHPLNDRFRKKVEQIKPYILVRRGDAVNKNILAEIKNIDIILVSELNIIYSFIDDSDREYRLTPYENIFCRSTGHAYISVPSSYSNAEELFTTYDFYESFSELITVILDVAKDKESYKSLMRNSLEISKKEIIDDFGMSVETRITEAAKSLGFLLSKKESFWNIVQSASGCEIDTSEFDEMAINYTNINDEGNVNYLIEIFKKFTIDVNDFNNNCDSDFVINLENFYLKEIREKLNNLRESFLSYKLGQFNSINLEQKGIAFNLIEKKYAFLWEGLNKFKLNSVHIEVDKIVLNLLEVNNLDQITSIELVDFVKLKKRNREIFESKNRQKYSVIVDKCDDSQIDIYSLFNELEELYLATNENNPESKIVIANTPVGLSTEEIKLKAGIAEVTGEEVSIKPSTPVRYTPGGLNGNNFGTTISDSQKLNDNGCIAELFVYNKLCEQYPNKVKWVSSNARKILDNVECDDSLGYDIKFIDDESNEHLVEVKSSQESGLKIKISRNEVNVGLANPKSYDIHYVNLSREQEPIKYSIINRIFDFAEGEDFFNNSKFAVQTENYEIRAKKIEKS